MAQVEVNYFEVHFPCLDLGKVQDVIDDLQQGFSRATHGLGIIALLGVQIGVQQQMGHADDPVHRGANFMAHVRQELAFGDIGRFSLNTGLL